MRRRRFGLNDVLIYFPLNNNLKRFYYLEENKNFGIISGVNLHVNNYGPYFIENGVFIFNTDRENIIEISNKLDKYYEK